VYESPLHPRRLTPNRIPSAVLPLGEERRVWRRSAALGVMVIGSFSFFRFGVEGVLVGVLEVGEGAVAAVEKKEMVPAAGGGCRRVLLLSIVIPLR